MEKHEEKKFRLWKDFTGLFFRKSKRAWMRSTMFLCKELMPGYLNGITGEYAPPAGYLVNEKEAEAFDREFPYMEKKKLPGQIF